MAKASSGPARRRAGLSPGQWKLVTAGLLGLAAGAALRWAGLHPGVATILGWDVACLTFCLLLLPRMMGGTPELMRERAAADDEGRSVILTLVLLVATVSLVAVADELRHARDQDGLARALHVALAFATVAASWFVAHLCFALHYAHAYYDPDCETADGDAEGLKFPGDKPPDYWDFLHFSLIIAVACQTADVAITSQGLRRLSTFHSLFAFAFNTVIVALTINLLAGLFQ